MFSLRLETEIHIAARPERVWRLLTDFAAFDGWNPMLRRMRGEARPGSRLAFEVVLPGGRALKLRARMSDVEEPRLLAWTGGTPALIAGRHYFEIEPLPGGGIRLRHGEHFRGPLLPLLLGKLRSARSLYESLNLALKQRAEVEGGS